MTIIYRRLLASQTSVCVLSSGGAAADTDRGNTAGGLDRMCSFVVRALDLLNS